MLGGIRISLASLLAGCGGPDRSEEAKALVERAFADANRGGDFGTEVVGKGVWFRTDVFDAACLQGKDLAFGDDPARRTGTSPSICPTYAAQRFFTAGSADGWCVLLGKDLAMQVGEVETQEDGSMLVHLSYSAGGSTTPYWSCVTPDALSEPVRVVADAAGTLSIEGDLALHRGGCPSPMPPAVTDRKGGSRPTAKPPRPPSLDDARAAAKRLDDAVWAHDAVAALEALSCFNLFEQEKYGSCSTAEVLNLGPITRGAPRVEDGPPWHMNTFQSLDDLGPITADPKDPTMFHVRVKAASGKHKARSMALQWVGDGFELVAVVGAMAEGLTTAQVVYDLDRPDRRAIFERRMKGEAIGEDGLPSNPMVRMGYEEAEE